MNATSQDRGAAAPRRIVCAGAPRTGSTWLFNAVRLLCLGENGDVHAAWAADYDPNAPAKVHIVKLHDPKEMTFSPDLVLTVYRPLSASLASLVRMGWLRLDPAVIRRAAAGQEDRRAYWRARTDLELDFAEITSEPSVALGRLSSVLGLSPGPARLAAIEREIAQLETPRAGGYDKETLLHPNHRSDGSETERIRQSIDAILTGSPAAR